MPTLVAFSGKQGDCILVEEELSDAHDKLGVGNRSGAGLCQLTQIPMEMQKFKPCTVLINPDRIAYIRDPNQQ